MKSNFIIFLLFVFMFSTSLWAENRLNFFIGDVKLEIDGKNVEPKIGMALPANTVIITGKQSQAHIFDTALGVVTSIQPEQKVALASLVTKKQNKNLSIWDKLRKEKHSITPSPKAAVRGEEEGRMELEWDDGNQTQSREVDRTAEWILFGEKQYEKVIAMTRNAKDIDGLFLHAASTYYLKGISTAPKVTPVLEKAIAESAKTVIKTEGHTILAALHFEQGRFDVAWEHMSAAAKNMPESEISEVGYFILAQSAFFTNRIDEGRFYIKKMKQYYGDSPLIEHIAWR